MGGFWGILNSNVCQFVKIGAKEFGPFNVVPHVDLFVLGVSSVVRCTNWQKDDVLAGCLLQGNGDRNGSTFSCKIWFDSVDPLDGATSSNVVGM